MCGICGQIRFDGVPADTEMVLRMRTAIRHRGPDDEGLWSERFDRGGVAFGHVRLSIIDLSSAGHQPMSNPSQRYWIVYNGEVYNYIELRRELERDGVSFRTHTDTEVVLAAYVKYGEQCVQRFNGMFAFAIWDTRGKRLFCARDRLGIKPFYYHVGRGCLIFASEIKALVQSGDVPREPNEERVYDYLSLCLMDHSSDTFFKGIHQLPPGHVLTFDGDGEKLYRYWHLPQKVHSPSSDPAQELADLFSDSVRLRLRSDVTVGILLSGGLDSSSIACAAAAQLSPERPRTFSSTFKNGGIDETEYSDAVVDHIRAENTKLYPQSDTFWDELDAMLIALDEPAHAADIYANWCMMREVQKSGVKVLLNGQGGDELFAGYGWYVKNFLASLMMRGRFGRAAREAVALRRNFPSSMTCSTLSLAANIVEALLPLRIRALCKPEFGGMRAVGKDRFLKMNRHHDTGNLGLANARTLEEKTRNDILFFNIPHYLHYEDRNSMHFGIEQRVPFLDHRLVEWAAALPIEWKIRDGTSKYVLRRAMWDSLPDKILARKDKAGLSIPVERWFRGDLADKVLDLFEGDCYIYERWVDRTRLLREVKRFVGGQNTSIARHVWRLFCLEKWCRLFFK